MSEEFLPEIGAAVQFKHSPKDKLVVVLYRISENEFRNYPVDAGQVLVADYDHPLEFHQLFCPVSMLEPYQERKRRGIVSASN